MRGGSDLKGHWLTQLNTDSKQFASQQLAKVVEKPGTNPYTQRTDVFVPKGTRVNIGYNVKGSPQIEVADDLSKLKFSEGFDLR